MNGISPFIKEAQEDTEYVILYTEKEMLIQIP
jgi:hypothetical protein